QAMRTEHAVRIERRLEALVQLEHGRVQEHQWFPVWRAKVCGVSARFAGSLEHLLSGGVGGGPPQTSVPLYYLLTGHRERRCGGRDRQAPERAAERIERLLAHGAPEGGSVCDRLAADFGPRRGDAQLAPRQPDAEGGSDVARGGDRERLRGPA